MTGASGAPRIGVVIATRNRRERLAQTLREMRRTDPGVPVVVVDNGSDDGTADTARSLGAETIRLDENRGTGARNIGAARLGTEYVAFSDDDSWWTPGSLDRAVDLLDRNPEIALLAARVRIGPGGPVDPVCLEMKASPIAAANPWRDRPRNHGPGLPGVVGFVACGAVVRHDPFREVGGFEERLGVGAEEAVLALDLWSAGHRLAYAEEVEAVHKPETGPRPGRIRAIMRNRIWVAWLRRPFLAAVRVTGTVLREKGGVSAAVRALRGVGWVLPERRVVPARVESLLRRVESETPKIEIREVTQ